MFCISFELCERMPKKMELNGLRKKMLGSLVSVASCVSGA